MSDLSPEIQVAIARTRDEVARLHEELVRYELVVRATTAPPAW